MVPRSKRAVALALSTALLAGCADLIGSLGLLAGTPAPSGSGTPAPSPSPDSSPAPSESTIPAASAGPSATPSPASSYPPPLFTPASFVPFGLFGKESALGIHAAGNILMVDHEMGEQAISIDGGQTWTQAPHPLTPFGYRVLDDGTDAWAIGVQEQGQNSFIRVFRLSGGAWVDASAGLPADFFSGAVAGGTLYLAGALGTYKRSGDSWTTVGQPPSADPGEQMVPVAAAASGMTMFALYKGQGAAQLYSLDLAQSGAAWQAVGSTLADPGYRISMVVSGQEILVGHAAGVSTIDASATSPSWVTYTEVPEAALFSLPSGIYRTQLPGQQGAPPLQSFGKLLGDGTWSTVPVPGTGVVGLAESNGYLYSATMNALFRRPVSGGGAWERVVIDAYSTSAYVVAEDGQLFGDTGAGGSAKTIPLSGGRWADLGLPTGSDGYARVGIFGVRLSALTFKFGPSGPDTTTATLYLRQGGGWQSLDLPADLIQGAGLAGYEGGFAYYSRPEGGALRIERRAFPGSGTWEQDGPDLPLSTTDMATARVVGGKVWVLRSGANGNEVIVRPVGAGSEWQAVPLDKSLLYVENMVELWVSGGRPYLGQTPGNGHPTKVLRVTEEGLVPTTGLILRGMNEPRFDSDGAWVYGCGATAEGGIGIQRMPLDGDRWESLGASPPGQGTFLGGCTVDRAGKRLVVSTQDGMWISQ